MTFLRLILWDPDKIASSCKLFKFTSIEGGAFRPLSDDI